MACPTLMTGTRFLSTALGSIDCHARNIGSYGFGALSAPDSPAALALTGLVTLFIALFGIRLMFGPTPGGRDTVGGVVRIGFVLLLATSWPAWRVLGYDLVLDGPVEIAGTVGSAAGLVSSKSNLIGQLQNADDGIVVVTIYGSGRLTGGISAGADLGDQASGVALSDSLALGLGRTIFLASTLGSFAIVRLMAGLLLALAPVMAGFALFSGTLGIFTGWLRGLAFCALGSVAIFVLKGAELAMLLPWISDVTALREANALAPSAPIELLVLTSAFAILTAGALFIVARLSFFEIAWSGATKTKQLMQSSFLGREVHRQPRLAEASDQQSHAASVSESIAASIRRHETRELSDREIVRSSTASENETAGAASGSQLRTRKVTLLGDEFRRSRRRTSSANMKRDRTA